MRKILLLVIASACLAVASARAQVTYDLTGTFAPNSVQTLFSDAGSSFDLTFVVPTPATPTGSTADTFTLNPISVSYRLDGQVVSFPGSTLTSQFAFLDTAAGGGITGSLFLQNQSFNFDLAGDSLFSGTTTNPVFKTGSFTLAGDFQVSLNTSGTSTFPLTVSNLTLVGQPTVPEPSPAVALLALGAAAAAFASWSTRRRLA